MPKVQALPPISTPPIVIVGLQQGAGGSLPTSSGIIGSDAIPGLNVPLNDTYLANDGNTYGSQGQLVEGANVGQKGRLNPPPPRQTTHTFNPQWNGFFRKFRNAFNAFQTPQVVANLVGTVGDRAYVSDSTTTTFNAVATGGGTNHVPVHFDGTNWRIG